MRGREYGEERRCIEGTLVFVIVFILLPNPVVVPILVNILELWRVFVVTVFAPACASCASTACRSKPWGAVAGC
jgi:hypothetical protein